MAYPAPYFGFHDHLSELLIGAYKSVFPAIAD
jgi:hypothetical protein